MQTPCEQPETVHIEPISTSCFGGMPERDARELQAQMEASIRQVKRQLTEMDDSISRVVGEKRQKQTAVGGNINNVYFGTSIERIVIYVCITIIAVTWLTVRQ